MYIHYLTKKTHLSKGRVSAFALKSSITLEAALSVSIFFFGVLCLVGLFEIHMTKTRVKSALHAVAREVALEVCTNPRIPTEKMEREIATVIGEKDLQNSLSVGGERGFDCSESKSYWGTTIMDLTVRYELEIPVLMFRVPFISQKEVVRVKGWNGYEEKKSNIGEEELVYVTTYGKVYHRTLNCCYLELSVRPATKEDAMQMNYSICEYCAESAEANKVYITDYGEKYHYSLECQGIKRNIYTVPVSKVAGREGCSKCVK